MDKTGRLIADRVDVLQITALNSEVNQLIEQRMRSGDPTEDKLSLFRQQVLMRY